MRPNRSLTWILLLATVFLYAGCGNKTSPVPPQTVLPEKITDLRYTIAESGITLLWNWPERTEQGGRIRKLSHFLIEKAEQPGDKFCGECPVKYDTRVKIEAGPVPADKGTRQVSYHETGLKPGYHYVYRVSSSMGWNVVSDPSQPVSLAWEIPLASPGELSAEAGDSKIDISWQTVSRDINENPVTENISYQVYRSSGENEFFPLGSPVSKTEYHDSRVSNGNLYRYQVMAVRTGGGGGRFSKTVTARPSDLTPPPAPRGLQAVKTIDGVSLVWEPVVAADLAGYKVFRRNTYQAPEPGKKYLDQDLGYKEIGTVPDPATSFSDHTPPKNAAAWHYAIGSFDQAEPPNISPLSWEVKIKREQ